MRVLIGMEESQAICIAFRNQGHKAFSCDLKPCSGGHPEWHYKCDIYEVLYLGWDIIIMHPECTAMAVSGNRFYNESKERVFAITYTEKLWIDCIAICDQVCFEQPVSVLASSIVLPEPQYIQPHQFGHAENKKTALYLHGLSYLISTESVLSKLKNLPDKIKNRIHYATGMPKGKRRELRSKTYSGISEAMACQWGNPKNFRTKPFFKL